MGRPAKEYTDREKQQDYKFQCILYPDSKEYDCEILKNRLGSFWDHAVYILHDKDFYTETDVDLWKADHKSDDCPFGVGELKKPHYHVIAWKKSPLLLGCAADKFGIDSNMVQRVKSLKGAIRYLIHCDNPEKFQYDVSAINRVDLEEKELLKYLKIEVNALDKGKKLFEYILTHERITLMQLTRFSFENDCYDELRRGQHLYTALLVERNGK